MTMLKLIFSAIPFLVCLACPPLSVAQDDAAADDIQTFAKSLPLLGPELKVGEAMLFDLESGSLLRTFRRYKAYLRHVRVSPDGKNALLGFYDFSVLWSLNSGEVVREFDQGGIAQFSPDGSTALIYDALIAHRYEVASGKHLASIQLPPFGSGFKSRSARNNAHLSNEVQYDSSGTLIYNVKPTGVQQILDAGTGQEVGQCPSNTDWCFVSGATQRVLHGGPSRPYNVVRVFDFAKQEVARFDMPQGEATGVGGQLKAVSSDGRQFLYARHVKGGGDNTGPNAQYRTMHYALYDAETGEELMSLGRFDTRYNACISPDGQLTVLLPTFGFEGDDIRDSAIQVIDNVSGVVIHRLYTGPWSLSSVEFDGTGNRLLVAGSIDFQFWRRFGEWRLLEKQNPMPRKVADALLIIKDWQETELRPYLE